MRFRGKKKLQTMGFGFLGVVILIIMAIDFIKEHATVFITIGILFVVMFVFLLVNKSKKNTEK